MGDITINFEANSVNFASVNFDLSGLAPILATLTDLGTKIDLLQQKGDLSLAREGFIMSAMDDVEAKLTAVETRGESVGVLLNTLHQELLDMIASGATPARLQALADRLVKDEQKLVDAANANPDPLAGATGPSP